MLVWVWVLGVGMGGGWCVWRPSAQLQPAPARDRHSLQQARIKHGLGHTRDARTHVVLRDPHPGWGNGGHARLAVYVTMSATGVAHPLAPGPCAAMGDTRGAARIPPLHGVHRGPVRPPTLCKALMCKAEGTHGVVLVKLQPGGALASNDKR